MDRWKWYHRMAFWPL